MVRVLSCYHFRGQKIGRCDEAAAVAVAGQSIVIGIEDSITVYNASHPFQSSESYDVTYCNDGGSVNIHSLYQHHVPEVGMPICFATFQKSPMSPGEDRRTDSTCSENAQSGSCSSSVSSIESDTEIKLSHSFPTVDLVRSLTFNKKGNYLLCLECRDVEGGRNKCGSIRVYFHWDKRVDALPMRTRIAGISPSANDLEKPALTMVEIPLTSRAIAVASCPLTGHLASLAAESVVHIFSFRVKEVSGRGKMQYPDFDRLCAIEITGFSPESLSFMGNFVSCTGSGKVHVFQIHKPDKSWSPSSVVSGDKYGMTKPKPSSQTSSSKFRPKDNSKSNNFDYSNKVVYNPNDDSVTVHLPSITKANRKRAGNSVVVEEYSLEIMSNQSKIIYSSAIAGINIEDVLRLTVPQSGTGVGSERILETGLYPIRVKDKLGGVACIVGLTKEALLYHLSTKEKRHPIRIANFTFTAPLVTFTFDSLFFHALTESGLETYSSRSLFYALQDYEGFERYQNACPLKTEGPCLVGIRPFVRVRFMAANESLICLLACPTPLEGSPHNQPTFSPPLSPSILQDERLWTVYSLELPDIDMLFEDTMRLAKSQENQSDTYFTLLCELHLILRAYMSSSPEEAHHYVPRYRNLCKLIGMEYLQASSVLTSDSNEPTTTQGMISPVYASQTSFGALASCEELLELGVTYLCMAKLDIQHVFSLENAALTQEPHYIPGTVKLIEVLLSSYCAKTNDKHNFSPALSSNIVDFLYRNSPATLVQLAIDIPFLRENHSTRLVEILQDFANDRGYSGRESLALILTLIAGGGIEPNVRLQIRDVLQKVNAEELRDFLRLEFILDRSPTHSALTDLAICFTAVDSDLTATIISEAMKHREVSVSEVMLAFAKAVNLNSESQVQRSLARTLRHILESYFSNKISSATGGSGKLAMDGAKALFTEDERQAVQALVRSYISDISFSAPNKLLITPTESNHLAENSNEEEANSSQRQEHTNAEKSKIETTRPEKSTSKREGVPLDSTTDNVEITNKNQIFEKIPAFVNFLLSVDTPGGYMTPTAAYFGLSMFQNQENMESYIRLLSLLASPCGKVDGVKDSVLTFVYNNSSSVKSTPLQLILLMFCEPVETAISILISRQPTTVLLYAKEMFGKSTMKWKVLVTQLKKRINLNPNTADSDLFSTIIETVYLHLANTLTLTELEEVLEKGSDDLSKFRSTCKRVELANSYASMVIQISTEYLQSKQ